ncbi:formate dehydrogenase subunit gamma [Pseudohalioglobus sediminis]|uniref:formate dehydrogenase subunit gamma n=1 Tax=Pseudohalioglobus sediminis TaxID=2606449 RepID=UPI0021CE7C4A|nr:formate dehydrogenase subunit gamma [Pseudohalioglobus sediminis]
MDTERLLAQLLCQYQDTPGGLLPLLQAIQEDLGYIPGEAVPAIARVMNCSAAEVHGVISFYHDLRTAPGGRHTLQVCRAESCQATGGRELEACARDLLGVDFGNTTADGVITLESVYCLGNCACSPSVRLDNDTYARVDREGLAGLIASLRQGAEDTA